MKKLNLEKLKLAAEDVLQRSQLSTIYGGSGGSGCNYYACHCIDSTGSWTGYYCSEQEQENAFKRNCSSENGNCS
jgi:hypothetical protein